MRRAKRTLGHQPIGEAEGRVHLRGLERLGARERRQDRGDPPREHGLAGAGWPSEHQVVPARDRDLDRAAREVLPAYLDHVHDRGAHELRYPRLRGGQVSLAADGIGDLAEVRDAVHLEPLDDERLRRALCGDDHAAQPACFREHRCGEHTVNAANRAIEAELAEHEQICESFSVCAVREQHRRRDREIERRAGLAQICGCEVNDDLLERKVETERRERAADPGGAFLDRRCGETDDVVAGQARRDLAFDIDENGVDAIEGA